MPRAHLHREFIKEDEDRERLLTSGSRRNPLLSSAEAAAEFDAQPDDELATIETSTRFWALTGKKKAYALIIIVKPDSDDDDEFDPGGPQNCTRYPGPAGNRA